MFFRFALYGFLKNLRFFDPFLFLALREGGLSFLEIGTLYSVRAFSTNLLEIPSGLFADAFGRRRSLVLAFAGYIASFAIFYYFSDFVVYIAAMVLFGLGEAFRSGTHKALILEHLALEGKEDQKVSYYGRTRAASQLGSALNSLIAAAIVIFSDSYRYLFIAAAAPYVLGLINVATYPAELDGRVIHQRTRSLRDALRESVTGLVALLRDRYALRAILNSASFSASFKITKDYLQPIVQTLAVSVPLFAFADATTRTAVAIGLVYFALHLITSYASRSADRVSRRFDNLARAINVTYLLGAIALVAAGTAAWQDLAVVATLLFVSIYVLQNLRKPMTVAVISDHIDSKVMVSGLSVESQISTLFQVLFAPVVGALADRLGVGPALAIFGATVALLLTVVSVKSGRSLRGASDVRV